MAIRHDFICSKDNCDFRVFDVVCDGANPEAAAPDHCGIKMSIDWANLPQSVQEFTAFRTRNIHPDGKELLVRNKGDLQRYYKEYGVVHMDDPDLVAQGNEIVKKSKWRPSAFVDMGRRG